MKKIVLIYSLCFSFTLAFGQQKKTPKFQVKGIKAELGGSWDKYQDMSLNWMQSRTNNQSVFIQDLSQKNESVYYSSGGGVIGAQILLSSTAYSRFGKPELRLGIQSIMGKEAIIEYRDPVAQNQISEEDIMYCFVENEVQTSAELVWGFGEERFSFYTGVGTNVSGSFGNDLYIFTNFNNLRDWTGNNFSEIDNSSNQLVADGKSVLYSRFYVPMTASVKVLGHLELSATYAFGMGVEKVINGSTNTFRTGQFKLGLQYNLETNSNTRFSLIDALKGI